MLSGTEGWGRLTLVAGVSAAIVSGTFGYLHRIVLVDWPEIALDGPAAMFAYLTAGIAFQFGIPILCLAALTFGAPARHLWTARIGLTCAGASLLGYALYVRTCLDMIR